MFTYSRADNRLCILTISEGIGGLWENFAIVERLKYRAYHSISALQYFWRTYDGAEVDLIEEQGAKVRLYGCKWNAPKKGKNVPRDFQTGTQSQLDIITKDSLKGFLY